MKSIAKKADRTLAAAPKTHEVTAAMRRTFNALVFLAQEGRIQDPMHSAPVDRVLELAGYAPGDLSALKHNLTLMVGTPIEWDSPSSESQSWTVSTLIAGAKIGEDGKWLSWSYSIALWKELIYPAIYAEINLEDTWNLRTHAAMALFEICSRYVRPGSVASTPARSWRWWHQALVGHPVSAVLSEDEDEALRAFRREILVPALHEVERTGALQVEVNEITDPAHGILISFAVMRQGSSGIQTQSIGLSIQQQSTNEASPPLSTETAESTVASQHDFVQPVPRSPVARRFDFVAESLLPKPGDAAWDSAVTEIAAMTPANLEDLTVRFERALQEQNAHPSIARRLRSNGWRHHLVLPSLVAFFDRQRCAALTEPGHERRASAGGPPAPH
jgi:hypothetical protein